MRKEYITCLNILQQAFDANTLAHRCSEASQVWYRCGEYNQAREYSEAKKELYDEKLLKIKEAIRLIKKYKLPIKWGVNNGICYFSTHGRQISFHVFSSKACKGYNGKWSCRKNGGKFPIKIENIEKKLLGTKK